MMKKNLIILIELLALLFLAVPIFSEASCTANSNYDCVTCTQGEIGVCREPKDLTLDKVQAAVNDSAASNGTVYGDGIYLKPGTETWASGLDITNKKGLVLKGEGPSSTILNISGGSAIYFGGADRGRITGIHFDTVAGSHPMTGWGLNFRFDHCLFTGAASILIWWLDLHHNTGLVDNNIFTVNVPADIIYVRGTDGYTRQSFEVPIDFGSSDWVFVEDNIFNNLGDFIEMFETQNGGKMVVRYNTINEISPSWMATLFEQHNTGAWGADSGGAGGRAQEIYNNRINFTSPPGNYYSMLTWRSGTGLVYDNIVDYSARGTDPSIYFNLQNYREYDGCTGGSTSNTPDPTLCPTCLARCCSTAYVNGSLRGEGYPCVGGVGQGVYGGTPEPVYFWDNKKTADGKTLVDLTASDVYVDPSAEWALRLNRDYCVSTTGKPASCGGHNLTYNPYIYPHPLTVAPPGTDICDEGAISSECWCEEMKSDGSGYCCHGHYQSESCESSGAQPIPGDINGDGMVNVFDLSVVASDFGKTSGLNNTKSDTNSDNLVDIFDVVFVASRFS
jgi:hypothetical protein